MADHPPLPKPDVEMLDDEDLDQLFTGMCEGDDQSLLTLPHHQAHQFTAFALKRLGQLWVQIEQRTRA